MTRNSMKLVVSDDEMGLVQVALAREYHDRRGVFDNLNAQGHVRVVNDNDPAHINIQIEDEIISDDRDCFPTTGLMARLQLAVAAGRTCHNLPVEPYHSSDALTYAMLAHRSIDRYQQRGRLQRSNFPVRDMDYAGDAHIGQIIDHKVDMYEQVAADIRAMPAPSRKKRLTAAVKKFAKGLRP